ncbi:hypothetical protein CDAR_301541 [Caerostris darwini]|uniref:Uncharacterized protein n=1 Tax=Caerostris darwini TaxID=1538125 RepID=A0AAV4TPB6_9ARAC|nr:hypothetical protein CDAR_301541 [Caerostris darwini]
MSRIFRCQASAFNTPKENFDHPLDKKLSGISQRFVNRQYHRMRMSVQLHLNILQSENYQDLNTRIASVKFSEKLKQLNDCAFEFVSVMFAFSTKRYDS